MNFEKEVCLIEKKSKFYGFLLHTNSLEQIENALAELKKEHKKATHICYAFSLQSPFSEKAVDGGEPGGTAGRPILNVIQKRKENDVAIFVVRYFGGVKLGTGGLVRAYTKAASNLFVNTI